MNGHHCLPRHLGSPGGQEPVPAPAPRCCPWQGRASRDGVPLAPRLIHTVRGCDQYVHLPRGLASRYCWRRPLGLGRVTGSGGQGKPFIKLLPGIWAPDPGPRSPLPGPRRESGPGTYDLRQGEPEHLEQDKEAAGGGRGGHGGGGSQEEGGSGPRAHRRLRLRARRWLLSDDAAGPGPRNMRRGGAGGPRSLSPERTRGGKPVPSAQLRPAPSSSQRPPSVLAPDFPEAPALHSEERRRAGRRPRSCFCAWTQRAVKAPPPA